MTDTVQPNATLPRWSGLSGVLGSVVLLGVFVLVAVFVGPAPAEPEGLLLRFPDVRSAHIVENTLYLASIALWLLHVLGLYQATRSRRPAPALAGAGLTVLGLTMLAAGALPHLWQTPIADLYHAPGATAAERAMLVLQWQSVQGVFDALLMTGLLLIPAGYVAFGIALRATPELGSRVGGVGIGLGVVGLAVAGLAVVDFSTVAAVGVLVMVAFHLVVGWTVGRRSRRLTGATARRVSV